MRSSSGGNLPAADPEGLVRAAALIEKRLQGSGLFKRVGEKFGRLIDVATVLPQRFPLIRDAQGLPAPADVEFGFVQDRLVLFQVRPFLESARARKNLFLNRLDEAGRQSAEKSVNLDEIPGRPGG